MGDNSELTSIKGPSDKSESPTVLGGGKEAGKQAMIHEVYGLMSVSLVGTKYDYGSEPFAAQTEQRAIKPKEAGEKEKSDGKGDESFDRSRIARIRKVNEIEENGKKKDVFEEKDTSIPKDGEKLKPGTYEIQLQPGLYGAELGKPGRAFRICIPEGTKNDAPVMVVMPGSSSSRQDPRGYVKEVHMEEVAKADARKAIVVTALTERQPNGGSYWNHPDSLIPKGKLTKAKDGEYLADVDRATRALASATSNHDQWAWLAGSQGAAFLHSLASAAATASHDQYFASSDKFFKGKILHPITVGGSIPNGPLLDPGDNSVNGINIDTAGDVRVLSHEAYKLSLKEKLAISATASLAGLSAIDNINQNPDAQMYRALGTDSNGRIRVGDREITIYRSLDNSGLPKEFRVRAFVANNNDAKLKTASNFEPGEGRDKGTELTARTIDAARKAKQDIRWVYEVMRHGVKVHYEDYELPRANHVIPGDRKDSTSFFEKYENFNSAQVAYDFLWTNVDKQRSHK